MKKRLAEKISKRFIAKFGLIIDEEERKDWLKNNSNMKSETIEDLFQN